jgi:radical SAM superfamily enzyme YgiQ (UPF0313 family)
VIAKIAGIEKPPAVMLGGIHASVLPERTLRELDVDAVCIGDGEIPSVGFTEKVLRGETDYWNIPGVAAIDGKGQFRFSENLARTRPLRPLPRPAWHKIRIADYQECPLQYIRRRRVVAPIITTKGCPNRCSFCAVPRFSGSKLVPRDPVEVVDEIEYLVREHGVEELQLFDDNFNCNLEYAKRVLREWVKRDLPVIWKAAVGLWIHNYDDEWLTFLERSGCYQVGFGIESGSQKILDLANKRVTLDQIHHVLEMYQAHGISTFGFFVLGLPGETRETIRETIRFACSLPLDHMHAGLLTPYPGSPLFDQALASGMSPPDWSQFYHYHDTQAFKFCDLSTKELTRAMQQFYLRFYGTPRRALNMLNDIRRSGIRPFMHLTRQIFKL